MEAIIVTTIKDGVLENQRVFLTSDQQGSVKPAEDYFIEQCEDNGTTLNKEGREGVLDDGFFEESNMGFTPSGNSKSYEVYFRWTEVETI